MRFHPIFLLPVIFLLLLAGYTGYWYLASQTMEKALNAWVAQQEARGYQIHYGAVNITGFPVNLSLTAPDVVVQAPVGHGNWHWKGDAVTAKVQPWSIRSATLSLEGAHEVTPPDHWNMRQLSLENGGVSVDVIVGLNGLFGDAVLRLDGAAIKGVTPTGVVRVESLTANHVVLSREGGDSQTPTETWLIDGANIVLPTGAVPNMTPTIASLRLSATIMGVIGDGSAPDALAEWRDKGGTFRIEDLRMDWMPLNLQAAGTMTLDSKLQPIGSFNATIKGFFEAIDGLSRSGTINPVDGTMAKVVLGALARRPLDGGPATLNIPLTLQNGKLYVGNVPIFKPPTVTWDLGFEELTPVQPETPEAPMVAEDGTALPEITPGPGLIINPDGSVTIQRREPVKRPVDILEKPPEPAKKQGLFDRKY